MTISTTLSNIKDSSVSLNIISAVTVVAAAIAADRNKPILATSLVGFSTVLAAREVYVRHVRGAKTIQTILMKTNEVSEMDVPANIVAAMKAYQHTVMDFEPTEATCLESNSEFKIRLVKEFNEFKEGITRMYESDEITMERHDTLIDNGEALVAKLASEYPTYL